MDPGYLREKGFVLTNSFEDGPRASQEGHRGRASQPGIGGAPANQPANPSRRSPEERKRWLNQFEEKLREKLRKQGLDPEVATMARSQLEELEQEP